MAHQEQFGAEPATVPVFADEHYSPPQVAKMWNLDIKTVRRIFEREPGVLTIDNGELKGHISRRRYRTLRIPRQVLERVHERMSKGK
jgi:hypothetical protein